MIWLFFAVFLFAASTFTYANPEETMSYPPVTISGTELRELTSSSTGRDYHLYVHLPDGYAESEKSYPVLYLLDGQWNFKLMASVYFGLRRDMFVPEMIIVGITYGGESPDYGRLRAMDYTPTQAEGMEHTGDGPKFLAFLKEELIPFVEKNYRADSGDRALGGSSLAGLFVMYALFHEPELFHRYISTSPSLWWDDKVIFRYAQAFAEKNRKLPVRLFLSVGELDLELGMVEPMKQMAQILEERKYEGLVLTSMVISGERHVGQKPEAFNRGLRAVFAKSEIELSPDQLEVYVGKYQRVVEDGSDEWGSFTLTVTREGDRLFGQYSWDDEVRDEWFAETETHFFARAEPAELTFNRDADGKVEGITMHTFSGDWVVEKVE
jgi:predicted alpha/beta superfamily hydrolase